MADPQASARIFISYRREDSSGHVLALLPALRREFGDRIFKDTDSIPPGEDFVKFIKQELQSCSVLLAIIGKDWLTVQDPRRRTRRLDSPDDFLRVELSAALRSDRIRVIPVLIERATMPAASRARDAAGAVDFTYCERPREGARLRDRSALRHGLQRPESDRRHCGLSRRGGLAVLGFRFLQSEPGRLCYRALGRRRFSDFRLHRNPQLQAQTRHGGDRKAAPDVHAPQARCRLDHRVDRVRSGAEVVLTRRHFRLKAEATRQSQPRDRVSDWWLPAPRWAQGRL
jgi:hypothetical protein